MLRFGRESCLYPATWFGSWNNGASALVYWLHFLLIASERRSSSGNRTIRRDRESERLTTPGGRKLTALGQPSLPPGAEVGSALRIPARVRVSSAHLFNSYPGRAVGETPET